jgi:hypothetical protein
LFFSPIFGFRIEESLRYSEVRKRTEGGKETSLRLKRLIGHLLRQLEWKRFEELTVAYAQTKGLHCVATRHGADVGVDMYVGKSRDEEPYPSIPLLGHPKLTGNQITREHPTIYFCERERRKGCINCFQNEGGGSPLTTPYSSGHFPFGHL